MSLFTDSEIIRELVNNKRTNIRTVEEEINASFFSLNLSALETEFANRGLIKHLTSEEKERFDFLIQKIENPQKLKERYEEIREIRRKKAADNLRKENIKFLAIMISIIIFIIYMVYIFFIK